jgi:hypothetical protein
MVLPRTMSNSPGLFFLLFSHDIDAYRQKGPMWTQLVRLGSPDLLSLLLR